MSRNEVHMNEDYAKIEGKKRCKRILTGKNRVMSVTFDRRNRENLQR